ncbi:winged helix-turn-helix transcriptional regulator [Paenibacillus thermotolerans]|uniref:winged helix-turn-helix transcriptional regulator n=1 Tax=Paenibacillus thermotolerans TaxID=3027807 RepID=UPI0023686E66|nr:MULTISPECIES: helix-turn-helix domain-containing protein [unclassified Paenibacillus]
MKREDNKSFCPINLTVELFGDTWSLLIVRDMLALGKKTFGEFLESEERIGPSVLAERLVHLERKGIILKTPDENDRRKYVYTLTEKGMNLIPLMYEIAVWGSLNHPVTKAPDEWYASMKHDKELVVRLWREAVESGSSFFIGPNSVVSRLNLNQE